MQDVDRVRLAPHSAAMASDVVAVVAAAFPGRTVQIAELARLLGEVRIPTCLDGQPDGPSEPCSRSR